MEQALGRELRDLEFALLDPGVRSSRERVGAMLDDSFVEIGSSGRVWSRDEVIERLAGEAASEWSVSRFEALGLGADVALVRYAATRVDERGALHRSLRSSVWAKRAGAWRLVFHQGTPAE